MRANYHNRQSRRAALCIRIRARHPHGHELAIPPRKVANTRRKVAVSPRRLALTAHGHELARVAENIAAELELSPEMLDLLSPLGRATNHGRMLAHAGHASS